MRRDDARLVRSPGRGVNPGGAGPVVGGAQRDREDQNRKRREAGFRSGGVLLASVYFPHDEQTVAPNRF